MLEVWCMLSSWKVVVVGFDRVDALLAPVAHEYRAGGQVEERVEKRVVEKQEVEKQEVLEYEEQGLVQVV